jgi:hypothetical protein
MVAAFFVTTNGSPEVASLMAFNLLGAQTALLGALMLGLFVDF